MADRVVLVVDDHDGIRGLLRALFELDQPETLVIEAATASAALTAWRDHRPHAIVLDQYLEPDIGLEDVAAPILAVRPDQPIVLFTGFLDAAIRQRATELGLAACLTQDDLRRLPEVIDGLLTPA